MTDDIAVLIKRLKRWFTYENCGPAGPLRDDLSDAADALSRLTAAPLPEEIAGLIAWLQRLIKNPDVNVGMSPVMMASVKALRALAQENERLKTIAYQRWEIANARICELEAERDAIRHKTIEECAKLVEGTVESPLTRDSAARIRALAHAKTDEKK